MEQHDGHRRRRPILTELKRADGPELQVHGSPGLIQTLLEHDLIDEYRIWIFPLVIGTGKRLFGDGAIPIALRLVDSTTTATGVTVNTYVRGRRDRAGLVRVRGADRGGARAPRPADVACSIWSSTTY